MLSGAELERLSRRGFRKDFGREVMVPFLKKRGYDAVLYPNRMEGDTLHNGGVGEMGILVFDDSQIMQLDRNATEPSLREVGKARSSRGR